MFIEIVDSLRCPNVHAESWLVASCDLMDHRDIVTGRLGCPVCKAEYPIREGAVWFDPPGDVSRPGEDASEAAAMKIAAFLNLTDAFGFAILEGDWAVHAAFVSALTPTPLVLLNPTLGMSAQPGISTVHCVRRPPFAAASARAVAIGLTAGTLAEVLKPGGRAIGRSTVAVPPGLSEIARDESVWIAERDQTTVPITLTGRSHPQGFGR